MFEYVHWSIRKSTNWQLITLEFDSGRAVRIKFEDQYASMPARDIVAAINKTVATSGETPFGILIV